jgi:hypothetical protein
MSVLWAYFQHKRKLEFPFGRTSKIIELIIINYCFRYTVNVEDPVYIFKIVSTVSISVL